MNTTLRSNALRATAIASAAALALLVSACGDDTETAAPTTSATTSAAAPAAPAGKSAAAVDGKALDAGFETTCAKQGDTLALALTDNNNATYGQLTVSATVTGDTVQAVGIAGSKGGSAGMPYALGYGNGQPGGSAKLAKDGNTFTITGEGVGAPDMTNPLAGPSTATFEITFACTDIVGA
ncbi:lipoprotein LpqH [Nocardia farcinica]|uniref:lipoprotein LpqH n=1 Tax=Nocardia farcinica TaxID=37329 RepID=UPI000E01336D|nr:lipoprotein LpqH [Nocardia farcinica]MBF6362787.1 lipoprotein LpqH [Nocardia farcinica]SUE31635.1 19 kDa lipoprotein antigen [Nocardia farcinica]